MKPWQKAALLTLVTLVFAGIFLFTFYEQRKSSAAGPPPAPSRQRSLDDVAVVRMLFMQHYEDTLQLEGTSVWMKDGYTIPFYPVAAERIDFARAGLIAPGQRLDIKKIMKAVPPAGEDDGMSHGSSQVFAVFTMPGDAKLYAVPIGVINGGNEAYFCDVLFYYDDPHGIYDNWSKDTWAAVDAHQVKMGMNELQARSAVGQNVLNASGNEQGNRTVTYDANGKHWTVTFVNDRATSVKSE